MSRLAGELARTGALRGADAVHLASAHAVGGPELLFVAWDRQLHAAAGRTGLVTAPATLS